MTPRRAPLFVERETYRRRRLLDAARILPVVGLVALLLPILWSASGGASTAAEGIYLFGLWFALIAAAAALSRPLRDEVDRSDPTHRPVPTPADAASPDP